MFHNMYRLVSQIDVMETLCELPLALGWVQQAIKEAALEIERSEPGDPAANYARDIVKTLAELCGGALAPTLRIANSRVGEQIRLLAQHVENLGNAETMRANPR